MSKKTNTQAASDDDAQNQLPAKTASEQPPTREAMLASYERFDPARSMEQEEFDRAIDYLCAVLLFGTSWEQTALANPKIRRKIPTINDIPLMCQASECPYASVCPILAQMPVENWSELVGTRCRADQVYAVQMFADQVRSMGISPQHTTDIIQVADIVRWMIMYRRLDWELALAGMTEMRVDELNDRTGQVYLYRAPSELIKEMERMSKRISALQSTLMSTRRDRAQLEAERTSSDKGQLIDLLRAVRAKSSIIQQAADPEDLELSEDNESEPE